MIRQLKARLREHRAGYFWTERHAEPFTVVAIGIGDPWAVVSGHVAGDGRYPVIARFGSQHDILTWLAAASSS